MGKGKVTNETAIERLNFMQHQVSDGDSGFGEDEIEGAREDFAVLQLAIESIKSLDSANKEIKSLKAKIKKLESSISKLR